MISEELDHAGRSARGSVSRCLFLGDWRCLWGVANFLFPAGGDVVERPVLLVASSLYTGSGRNNKFGIHFCRELIRATFAFDIPGKL